MRHRILPCLVAWLTLAGTLSAFGALTQNWRIDAPNAPIQNDNETRGLAYNPSTGHLLVVRSSTSAPGIVVLKAADGATVGNMNITGVTGGTRPLVKVRVVDFGAAGYAVYACNLSINSKTETFKIYRWFGAAGASEDTLGAPEVIYANRAADAATAEATPVGPTLPQAFVAYSQRVGDTFWARLVSGSNVEFYVGVARANILNSVYKFAYTDPQVPPTSNTNVASVSEITLTGLPSDYGFGNALRGEYVDPVTGAIWHQTNGALAVYTNSGAFQSMITGVHSSALHGVPLAIGGKTYYCAIHHGLPKASTNAYARFSVTDVTSGPAQGQLVDFGPALATPNANANGTGDFATDGTNIFALVTNNYIGSWAITPPATGTVKQWLGAGLNASDWFDPGNWSPAGVPTPLDDVVLDHTNVTSAYTVKISSSTAEANCRTLTIGDPLSASNVITLRIETTTINEILNIGGDLNPATPDVNVRNGGRFEFAPGTLGGSTSIYYFDPTATGKVENGGYLQFNTSRSVATPFPGALPSGYIPVSYGAWSFDPGSTVEFLATSTAIPFSGRSFGNLILNGANYTASGGLPATIANTLTIGATATFKPSMTGPVILAGSVVNNNTTASDFNATPLIISNSMTWPANITISGDLVVPSGVTLTCNDPVTLGGDATGKIAHIFGTLTCNNTLTIKGTLAPRSGGVVNGLGSVTWGANGGFATDSPSGFANMPPQSSDFPGVTLSGAFSNVPLQGVGVWGFCGDVSGQAAGALVPGDVGGIVCATNGSVNLPGDYRCTKVLSLKRGRLVMNGGAGTLTLGMDTSNVGTLSYPSGEIALVQGTFKRWRGTAALASVDFPLVDPASGLRRMLTVSTSAALGAGGTIAVSFAPGDPGGWPFNLAANGNTNSMDNVNKVDPAGAYHLALGDGIDVGPSGDWTLVADVGGFAGVDPLGQKSVLVARDPTNPTSWVTLATPNAPTYNLHQLVQSISNPEHPSFGVLRLSSKGAVATVIYSGASDIAVAEPFPAGVTEWAAY
ncbi:MAG: hypothetical protein ACP5UB_07375 [Candidatus Sumerlaeaceae bacterium]